MMIFWNGARIMDQHIILSVRDGRSEGFAPSLKLERKVVCARRAEITVHYDDYAAPTKLKILAAYSLYGSDIHGPEKSENLF